MENEISSEKKSFFSGFLTYLPVVNWVLTIAVAVGMFALSTRDNQTVQASEITRIINEQKAVRDQINERKTERDKQIEELRRVMLTREVFDAYHAADAERMTRMEKMMEQLLSNQTR